MKKIKVNNATKQGFIEVRLGGVVDIAFPESNTRRGRVIEEGDISPTLDTGCEIGRVEEDDTEDENDSEYGVFTMEDGTKARIRKLTPKECFRLQGFPDEYFERAATVNSDTQLYKQAGNSVTVNVIYEIAKRLEL